MRCDLEHEYGVPLDGRGAAIWRSLGRRGPRRYETAGAYVAACRRISPELADVDGRLVAAGWRRMSPRRWVEDGHFDRFLAYWRAAADRPHIVGSCYNQAPDAVADAWQAGVPAVYVRAGLPLERFRVRNRRLPRRARLRLARAGRAALRTSIPARQAGARTWTVGALTRLGRLSPEAQRAVVHATDRALPAGRIVRPRDIAWADAAPIVRAIGTSDRARIAWAAGRRRTELAGRRIGSADLCPAYPDLEIRLAERLARGESPVSVSGGLTRREAHEWLSVAPSTAPAQWLLRRHLPPQAVTEAAAARSVPVARWLIGLWQRGGWGQLTRDRRVMHDGREYVYRLAARIDELLPEHVADGGSADAVFERVISDRLELCRQDHRVISRPLPDWPEMPPGIRLLATPAQIVERGDQHGHCVGGYVPQVAAGTRWIVSVETGADVSTAEIDAYRYVHQHRGPKNSDPTPAAKELLLAWTSAPPRGREEAA